MYICQPGRFFRPVKHIAFYTNREIKPEVACIKTRYDNVAWGKDEAKRLLISDSRSDRRLGKVMEDSIDKGWKNGKYQVFILSRPGDPEHVTLNNPLVNVREGKASAFVRKQRYTSIHQLRHAKNVWDL